MAQRIDNLRDKVIYPERISQVTDVMNAITAWEKSYTELVDMSAGNFKLDDKGRIGALKRLLPQEIVSSMILVSTNLRTYREARSFALEQATELRNSMPKKRTTQGQTNFMGQAQGDTDEDFDPWAQNASTAEDVPEEWTEEQIQSVIMALKGKRQRSAPFKG